MDKAKPLLYRLAFSTLHSRFIAAKAAQVHATALSNPAGYASALYGVARKCLRWGSWVENQPTWFVIERKGTLI